LKAPRNGTKRKVAPARSEVTKRARKELQGKGVSRAPSKSIVSSDDSDDEEDVWLVEGAEEEEVFFVSGSEEDTDEF
jgi:nicotinic acid phosphoribosyltransferase